MSSSKTSAQLIGIMILTGLITALVVGEGVYAWQKNQQNQVQSDLQNQISSLKQAGPTSSSTSDLSITISPTPTPPDVKPPASPTLQTYTDSGLGISFKYPSSISVLGSQSKSFPNADGGQLVVGSQLINITTSQVGLSHEFLLKDQGALQKGDPSTPVAGAVTDSYRLLKVPGALAREYTILHQNDACNVQFSHQALIYIKDTVVILTSVPNNQKIIQANPSYFTTDKQNCGTQVVWKDQAGFYRDLVAGKTDSISQEWYKILGQTIATFQLTPVSTATP